MGKNEKKQIRRYLRMSRAAFPVLYKTERKYFRTLKNKIYEYAESGGSITSDSLTREFGEPKEHYIQYLTLLGSAVLYRELKISKYLKRFVLFICISILAASAYIFIHAYQNYTAFMASEGICWVEETPHIISGSTTETENRNDVPTAADP